MSSTWGDKLAQLGRPNLDSGFSDQELQGIDEPKKITTNSWAQGIVANDSPRDAPQNAGFGPCTDIDVTRDDAMLQAPGVTVTDDVTPRSLKYIFQHASVDYATELVAVDPPWLGYKGVGAFTWVNLGIAATSITPWVAFNVAGTLIFSNGSDHTYSRLPNVGAVTDISAQVIARTFATAFGRAFAGAVTTGAGFQALGVVWNAANGSPTDWTSTGAGGQLLIANQLETDKVVALRPIGFQALGVLNRQSLWLGYNTQQAAQPADFQQRYIGIGCISERTARTTETGIIFLSDEGVFQFDMNGLTFLSGAITPLIYPIDYVNLDKYSAAYYPTRRRYVLSTPSNMFIYEMPDPTVNKPGRWLMRSLIADNVLTFANQSGFASWDTASGTWDSQTTTWDQTMIQQTNVPAQIYYTKGTQLGVEDGSALTQFGAALTPVWITPDNTKDDVLLEVTTLGFELEYVSTAPCTITFMVPTQDGSGFNGLTVCTRTLPSTGGLRFTRVISQVMPRSLGGRWRFSISAGNAQIYRVSQLYDPNSVAPAVELTL